MINRSNEAKSQKERLIKRAKYPSNEHERLKLLEKLEILDSIDEQAYDDLTHLAALICDVPISLVSLIDKNRQWFKSNHGLDAKETPRELAFCAHAILNNKTLYIPDSTKDKRFHDNPLVTGPPYVKFYAGVPLVLEGGLRVGTLCVIDNKPKKLSEEQLDSIERLARQVENILMLRLKLKEIDLEKIEKDNLLMAKAGELENRIMIEKTQEAARIGSWQVDLITNTCFWSKMTYDIHEVHPSKTITVEDGINYYVEEHQQIIADLVKKGIETKTGWDSQLKIKTAKNHIRWVRVIGYPVEIDNKLVRLEGTFQDVTESKEHQDEIHHLNKRLTLALEASNVGVWEWDIDSNELIWDKQMIALYGVSEESFEGAYIAWENGLHPDDKERAKSEIQAAINSNKKFDTEFRIITPKKEIRTLRALAEVVFNDENIACKMIGVNWDISEVIKKEDMLESAKLKAENALKAKSTFLANMSHEIRTPLNGIIGLTSLVLDYNLNKEVHGHIENIRDCGDSLLTLINDILDISKVESGKLTFEKISINLHDLVKSTIYPFLQKSVDKNIDIKINIDKNVPITVIGDPVRIRQVLFNLIGNAIKFTEKGIVDISIESLDIGNNTHKLNFKVSDTGIGIAKENISKLFNSFEQLDSSVTRKFGGTGLGLSICKNLVEMMGGEINVNSSLGKGSIFDFNIIVEADMTMKTISDTNTKTGAFRKKPSNSITLLVVEDNKVNQIVIKKILSSLGYNNVDYAENGKIAIDKVSNKEYDIIFMDVQMPVMDGHEATRIIKNNMNFDGVIVGLSANAFKEDKEKALSCGMDDYLEKPVKKQTLASFIEQFTCEDQKKAV